MQCKDCNKFKPSTRMEAGSPIFPNMRVVNGKCSVDSRICSSNDNCSCDGFSQK